MIAIVTSRQWYLKCREDLFLRDALQSKGIRCEIAVWSDNNMDWNVFSLVLIRSTWDYYLHYNDFCDWLKRLKAHGVLVANGVDRILINTDKEQQVRQLYKLQANVIPFSIWHSLKDIKYLWDEIVIKPTISASGYNTFLFDCRMKRNCLLLNNYVHQILESGLAVIAQPYINEIKNGEISLVYFNGRYSHAVLRYPGIIGQKKNAVPIKKVSDSILFLGEKICNAVGADSLLYMRVDIVETKTMPLIMEIEITEPDLYLTLKYDSPVNPVENFISEIQEYINHHSLRGIINE